MGLPGQLEKMSKVFATLALTALAGCVNPNTYTVPRALPRGEAQFLVAPEVSGFGGTLPGSGDLTRVLPVPPTIGVRYGLSDDWDIGGRLSNLAAASADLKWNPLVSRSFDLALDPGLEFYVLSGIGSSDVDSPSDETRAVLMVNLPVLLGFNVSPSITLMPSLGLSYAVAREPPDAASDIELSQVPHGLFARAGLGIDFRLGASFALHPELTVLHGVDELEDYFLFTGGLGIVFGSLPRY